ncbi:MAG: ABC transporter permease [Actinomycetota bacterium]|nr:MAG: ABC transporter permease [Actinomycetota bacterium]
MLAFFLVPLVIMLVYSFRAGTFIPEYSVFTLDNVRDFLSETNKLRLLWRSTVTSFIVGAAAVVFAYPVAYYLAFRAGRRAISLMLLLILPAMTSYLLRVMAWKIILGPEGALSSLFQTLGFGESTLPGLLYNRQAVIVTLVYVWIPFVALPIYASLSRLDKGLLEAAGDLGCPAWEAFLRVTLPLSAPGVIVGFFFVFIPTLGEWVTPVLVGGTGGIMYGNIIQDEFVNAFNWPAGSVMSIAMLLEMAVFIGVALVLYSVWRRRSLHGGGA